MASPWFLRSAGWASLLTGLMTGMSGCTATATVGPGNGGGASGSCGADGTIVGCVGASVGYSCTGLRSPDNDNASLNCSIGRAGAAGETLFCCIDDSAFSSACKSDASITSCGGSSFGLSCTGGESPAQGDSSLVCSAPVAGNNGESLYCCANYVASSGSTCAADPSASCGPSVIGFSCTGGDTPDQANASLACSSGTASATGTLYCCQTGGAGPGTTTPSCAVDGSLSCSGSTGYTCTGGATPAQTDATLTCGAGAATGSADAMGYCCHSGSTTTSVCNADTTLGCAAPSSGTTCTGSAVPDPSLSCGAGTPNGNATSYCCNTATTTTGCQIDSTVTGCPAGADGYSCPAGVSAETMTLLCDGGRADANGRTDYCCTPN